MQPILIVDDEAPLRDLVADALRLERSTTGDPLYEVRVASDPERAEALVADWAPAVAVLDIAMPGRTGVDFGIWLRARYPTCAVVLYSARDLRAIQAVVGALDVAGMVAKPFDLMKLLDLVRTCAYPHGIPARPLEP